MLYPSYIQVNTALNENKQHIHHHTKQKPKCNENNQNSTYFISTIIFNKQSNFVPYPKNPSSTWDANNTSASIRDPPFVCETT